MKRLTYTIGSASFLQQMRAAQAYMSKLHQIAIECGAEWDGQDGYGFTPEQYDRYRKEIERLP